MTRSDVERYVSLAIEEIIRRVKRTEMQESESVDTVGIQSGGAWSKFRFLGILGVKHMELTRNNHKELCVNVKYNVIQDLYVYFYGTVEYLKSLTLADLRGKLDRQLNFSYLFSNAKWSKSDKSDSDILWKDTTKTMPWYPLITFTPSLCTDEKNIFSELQSKIPRSDIIQLGVKFRNNSEYANLATFKYFGFEFLIKEAHNRLLSAIDGNLDEKLSQALLSFMLSKIPKVRSDYLFIDIPQISDPGLPKLKEDLFSYYLKPAIITDELSHSQRLHMMTDIESHSVIADTRPDIIVMTDAYDIDANDEPCILLGSDAMYPKSFDIDTETRYIRSDLSRRHRSQATDTRVDIVQSFKSLSKATAIDTVIYEIEINTVNND